MSEMRKVGRTGRRMKGWSIFVFGHASANNVGKMQVQRDISNYTI
jgi:hypothetical protein